MLRRHVMSARLALCHVRVLYQNELSYLQFFSPSGSHTILVFKTKYYGNIPTGTR